MAEKSQVYTLNNNIQLKFGLKLLDSEGSKYVIKVKPKSRAALAGFRHGDRILTVDGENVQDLNITTTDVMAQLKSKPGEVKVECVFDKVSRLVYSSYMQGKTSSRSGIRFFRKLFSRNQEMNNTIRPQGGENRRVPRNRGVSANVTLQATIARPIVERSQSQPEETEDSEDDQTGEDCSEGDEAEGDSITTTQRWAVNSKRNLPASEETTGCYLGPRKNPVVPSQSTSTCTQRKASYPNNVWSFLNYLRFLLVINKRDIN